MNNIVLLRTPTLTPMGGLNFSSVFPPISLGYLAAVLKEVNFNVNCIDAIGEDINRITPCEDVPGMQYRGISTDEIIAKIPAVIIFPELHGHHKKIHIFMSILHTTAFTLQ